jgi:hypothetical protein
VVGCGQGGDLDEVVGQDPLSGPDPGSVDAVEDAVVPAVLVGAENPVTSRDLHVLVYEAAESTSSQWVDGRAGACGVPERYTRC